MLCKNGIHENINSYFVYSVVERMKEYLFTTTLIYYFYLGAGLVKVIFLVMKYLYYTL